MGRLSDVSLLPQYLQRILAHADSKVFSPRTYLMTAMFTGAVVLARYIVASDMMMIVVKYVWTFYRK